MGGQVGGRGCRSGEGQAEQGWGDRGNGSGANRTGGGVSGRTGEWVDE